MISVVLSFFFKSFSNISKNKGETFTLGFVLESGRVFTFKAKISTPMKFLKSLKYFVDGLVHVPRYFLNFFQSCAFLKRQISDFMMVKNFIDFLTFFQEKRKEKVNG